MKQPDTTLAKADTVALWHAVQWMEAVLREWRQGGFKDDADRAKHQGQLETLRLAKRALRKVNAIRKRQAEVSKFRNLENCRLSEELQARRKAAGAPS